MCLWDLADALRTACMLFRQVTSWLPRGAYNTSSAGPLPWLQTEYFYEDVLPLLHVAPEGPPEMVCCRFSAQAGPNPACTSRLFLPAGWPHRLLIGFLLSD